VPVSLIGTFAIFPMLGFSINVLSLLGLVLAIGIVVDDAIVVVEAVVHHIEHGSTPVEAANKAMDEVSGPVVAIALVLSAVFVPVAFMGGITGRLYQQFAITIAISVILSAIGALSLSPALSAMLLRKAEPKKGPLGKFFAWFNKVFDKFTGGYVGFTGILVRKMARSMIFIGLMCVAIVLLGKKIPGGFVPEEDQGYVLANVKMQDATSLQRTDETAKKVEQILMATPGVASVVTITGYSLVTQSYASNTAFFFVTLKPWEERKEAAEHAKGVVGVANATFQRDVPQALAFAFGPPAIPGLGTGAGFSIFVQDRTGVTPAALADKTQEFIAAARARPEIGNAVTLYSANVPQIFADIDRDKVMTLGLQLSDVNTTIGAFLGGQYINDFNRFGRLYKVYVQAEPQYRATAEQLQFFYVRNAKGEMVPLSTIVRTSRTNGPEYTNRFNLYRAAEVTGAPKPGYSSAQALAALKEVGDSVLVPAGFGYQFNAMSYQEEAAAGKGAVVFGMALVFVFLILAAQYESWSLPFSVLLGTPFAVFGAFLGLWLARLVSPSYENNVFAQIGLVMLIGLAAKNAILIVEFARAKTHEGMDFVPAALEAAKLRFRPILMTAFAFILGVVPLLTASGAGAEARKVMGMAVFSGMLIATIFGVLLVPVLFVLIEKIGNRGKKPTTTAPAAPAATGGH
jgi:HAE1 family hydrophobic/amphiphilic exporter-1